MTSFTMHRRKSVTLVVAVLLGLIAVETAGVHVILVRWSTPAAWLATATSLSAMAWMIADLRALRRQPLRVTDDAVVVAVGLRWRVTIPRDAITGVALGDSVPDGALPAKVLEPNVIVTLQRPIEARGPFGALRTASIVALTVDEPERLVELLRAAP